MAQNDYVVDLRVAQLLCSRVCHDLVGLSGNLLMGMDMIRQENESIGEAFELVDISGQQLAKRLSLFRICFGQSSFGEGKVHIHEIRSLLRSVLQMQEIELYWQSEADDIFLPVMTSDTIKLILNLALTVSACIPQGGEVSIFFAPLSRKEVGVALRASGEGTSLPLDIHEALLLECSTENLTPRNIQSWFTGCFAKKLHVNLEVGDNFTGEVKIACILFASEKE